MIPFEYSSSIAQSKWIRFHDEKQMRKKVPLVITILRL